MCINKQPDAEAVVLNLPPNTNFHVFIYLCSVCSAFKGQYGLPGLGSTWKVLLTTSA